MKKDSHHTAESKKHLSKLLKGRKIWCEDLHLSEEHRRKISESEKGKVISQEAVEKLRKINLGSKHTEATKEKMSLERRGSKHWNWQGGKSKRPYPFDWTKTLRESIRQRDGYKCQNCGVPQQECLRKLCVHHIDEDKDNLDPKNLICLCVSCHMRRHYNVKNLFAPWSGQNN